MAAGPAALGYRERTEQLVLDQDIELKLSLRPLSPLPLPNAGRGTAALPQGPASATPVDCTEPSYFDRRGIKRYRPECLREAP